MRKKTILFATDFSKNSEQAFEIACSLALAWKAKLMIVHAEDEYVPPDVKVPSSEVPKQKLLNVVPRDLAIHYEHKLLLGAPAKSLVHYAKELPVDLIVMGTHGRQGMDRIWMGSVASQVVRSAPCPVLTVRQHRESEKRARPMTKILVPTDFSLFSYAALDYATALAQFYKAGVTVLFVDNAADSESNEVSERQQNNWELLRKIKPLTKSYVDIGYKLLNGDPAEQIVAYAEEKDYDFIVLGTHGRTGALQLLMGSVAEKVLRNSPCPVLTVKPSDVRAPSLPTTI